MFCFGLFFQFNYYYECVCPSRKAVYHSPVGRAGYTPPPPPAPFLYPLLCATSIIPMHGINQMWILLGGALVRQK